jgi:hypothetical protein
MTDADDEPKFTSIKERIAALKLQNAAGGAPPEAGRRPAPVLAAAKWVQV